MPGPASLLETDPLLAGRFCKLLRQGIPRVAACTGCGFSYDTMYGWVRRGLVPDAPEPYASFARDVYKAELSYLRRALRKLNTANPDNDNRALEWLLERRFPKAFGKGLHEPADPIEDVGRELAAAEASAGQLEAGGDGGALDEDRWTVVEEWFLARPQRLLELARKTGLAQAAMEEPVKQKGEGDDNA